MFDKVIIVKMGEMAVIKDKFDSNIILKTTLGSCVGIVCMDRMNKVSGLSHIMLPKMIREDTAIGKYADTAIPAMLNKMKNMGAKIVNIKAYIVGGASMFGNGNELLNVGEKNIEAVREILKKYNIPIIYEDVGGKYGRTVVYYHGTGEIEVKTLNSLLKSKPKTKVKVEVNA